MFSGSTFEDATKVKLVREKRKLVNLSARENIFYLVNWSDAKNTLEVSKKQRDAAKSENSRA